MTAAGSLGPTCTIPWRWSGNYCGDGEISVTKVCSLLKYAPSNLRFFGNEASLESFTLLFLILVRLLSRWSVIHLYFKRSETDILIARNGNRFILLIEIPEVINFYLSRIFHRLVLRIKLWEVAVLDPEVLIFYGSHDNLEMNSCNLETVMMER